MQFFRYFLLGLMCISSAQSMASTEVSTFSELTPKLLSRKYEERKSAADWLVETQAELAKPVLSQWLEGSLYVQPPSHTLYSIASFKKGQTAVQIPSGEKTVIQTKRDFKKAKLNNKLRSYLRLQLAKIDLLSPNDDIRLAASKKLIGTKDPSLIALISEQEKREKNAEIKQLLTLSLNLDLAKNGKGELQLEAIRTIAESKQEAVFQVLNQLQNQSTDAVVLEATHKAIKQYQESQRLYSGIETLFFGLSLGSVLVLAGIGLAITFGVMGVINMAHGELIMIGAYTTYVIQQIMPSYPGIALLLSIPAAFMVSALVGITIERSVIRHLYGRPLETLLATFGISLILQQAVRSIFSPLNRSVTTPEFLSGSLEVNPMLALTYNRLYIILFCIAAFAGLMMILKKTPLGLQVRAVSQNRPMAKAMGIRSERVDIMTFGLGSGVAGIAGVALSQLTNVGPNMGQAYIIDSFMVVVFGGVGNLWGTLVAGLSLGVFNKILEPWAGAVLAKILVLVFIILFIQKRPRGLFPQRGRAAEG
ncbi:urea ABC transporter permease subunit UrtB [Vibrio sp. vnigr-6D03]|nr:urea ABC transporter permease subunit UrtB [Vibrio sp. vnigr-6D03]